MKRADHIKSQREKVADLYNREGGNVSAIARAMGLTRSTVRKHLRNIGSPDKPLVGGTTGKAMAEKLALPPAGRIRRYLLTSAQSNTMVNEAMWRSLNALARHYDAAIMVGTFTYNTNAYGKLSVKRGRAHEKQDTLWYDPRLAEHIVDQRIELGDGLVWCGEMNILPTAVNPLAGLETYTHRKSAIFPHAKLAMRSVATMQGEGTKLNYTTGTVTVHNYIQKREGLIAEHHHAYGALLVEVNDKGRWWVRQVACDQKGRMQDLCVVADGDKVTTDGQVEAVTWGDLHAACSDTRVVEASLDMLDRLMPKFQFFHDVFEGASFNRHQEKDKNQHYGFYRWKRGLHQVEREVLLTKALLELYKRPWSGHVVVDSNHDGFWLKSWLAKHDWRSDPANSILFLDLQKFVYDQLNRGTMPKDVNLMAELFRRFMLTGFTFLLPDESFTILNKRIECGMHGHLGPDGARGTPASLNKVGRRANTAHTHSAGIYNGLYVAGTSSVLKWDYNYGPSSWSHSHILTYGNGARTIVTMYDGRWRA